MLQGVAIHSLVNRISSVDFYYFEDCSKNAQYWAIYMQKIATYKM